MRRPVPLLFGLLMTHLTVGSDARAANLPAKNVGDHVQEVFATTTRKMGHSLERMRDEVFAGFAPPQDCGPVKLTEFTGREYTLHGFKLGNQGCNFTWALDLSWWRARRNPRGQVELTGVENAPGAPITNPHFAVGELGVFKLHNAAQAANCKLPDLTEIQVAPFPTRPGPAGARVRTGDLQITLRGEARGMFASQPQLPVAWRQPFTSACQHQPVNGEDFFGCTLPDTKTKIIFKVIDPAVPMKRRCR